MWKIKLQLIMQVSSLTQTVQPLLQETASEQKIDDINHDGHDVE